MSTSTPAKNAPVKSKQIRIGTRSSLLAIAQTQIVADKLNAFYNPPAAEGSQAKSSQTARYEFVIVDRETGGDLNQAPLHSIAAKSLWTKELEVMMGAGQVDMIVHSLKDMPTALDPAYKIGAITTRSEGRDCFVMRAGSTYTSLSSLPAGSVIGTSSVRRMAQLRRSYPHLVLADMRGNIVTRLKKLDDETRGFDCAILAAAGLQRIDLGERITGFLGYPEMLWGVGQGALGVEVRSEDEEIGEMMKILTHRPTELACLAERSLMRTLEGGCSVPIGVDTEWVGEHGERSEHSELKMRGGEPKLEEEDFAGGTLRMRARVVSVDGSEMVERVLQKHVSSVEEAEAFGVEVAAELVQAGAQPLLDKINETRVDTVED